MQEILKGTFLEEIIAIAQKGEFVEIDGAPVAEDGDIFLGEATLLEKACRTFSYLGNEKAKEMVVTGIPVEEDGIQVIMRPVALAEEMFWTLIQNHFPSNKNLGIRQGWQIVEVTSRKKDDCDCSGCRAMRQGISEGVMIIEVSGPSGRKKGFLSGLFGGR